ncbi:hypothetical protein FOH10_14960 [Nocardia otitidiscaviarum]|uniref:Uncharacterized protein n=2 Tax=Nocardia otitidiscaviarum TaxID=1823 RepID=A0A516NLN1_9NOCA|nr:hypothetical protein [Nocardia otitidiscaviarum]MCP9618758.1 hypothetical protein [Nocardia otitidiscaviarum]QDP79820.1 hypothetical protein FOH10_14960 [Nocardia otitidiscaviarum]
MNSAATEEQYAPAGEERPMRAYVADVSVDDGPATPMLCLLTRTGEVVIPTVPDDPPVPDGMTHVVRVEPRRPWANLAPGQSVSAPDDYRLWHLGVGSSGSSPMAGAAPLALTVGTAAVPRSLTRTRPAPGPAAHDGVRLALAAVAALSGAVGVVLIVRALRARTE